MSTSRLEYAAQKFEAAVHAMATSSRSIQDRLRTAATTWIAVKADDFPEGQLREGLLALQRELNSEPAKADEGTLNATLRIMTDDKAERIAQLVVDLSAALQRALYRR